MRMRKKNIFQINFLFFRCRRLFTKVIFKEFKIVIDRVSSDIVRNDPSIVVVVLVQRCNTHLKDGWKIESSEERMHHDASINDPTSEKHAMLVKVLPMVGEEVVCDDFSLRPRFESRVDREVVVFELVRREEEVQAESRS